MFITVPIGQATSIFSCGGDVPSALERAIDSMRTGSTLGGGEDEMDVYAARDGHVS